jgi:dynein heavy chain
MEVMIVNVINSAFDTVTYVELGIEVLDAFMHLNTREVTNIENIISVF